MTKSIAMPPLEKWHPAAELPADHQCVMALVEFEDCQFVAQCTFRGNAFVCEMLLGNRSVPYTHWLPITVDDECPP